MLGRILLGIATSVLILTVGLALPPHNPDPELIRLAVRATMHALPTTTPLVAEVTRIVEVTRVVEVTRLPTEPPEPTAPAEASASPSPTPSPVIESSETPTPEAYTPSEVHASSLLPNESAQSLSIETGAENVENKCAASSGNTYELVPVTGSSIDHPDYLHGDLNLSLRGYTPVDAIEGLVEINGPKDGDPPQLWTALPDVDGPIITQTYAVNDWDWKCGEHGCKAGDHVSGEVSLIGLRTTPGMRISIPFRNAEIYGGGYVALVLFAEPHRLTVVYTREDTVANGYAVHLEKLCVDPALVGAYRSANQAGRHSLPALHNGDTVGVASGSEIAVAVRDRGTFTDPRSRKDWWQ